MQMRNVPIALLLASLPIVFSAQADATFAQTASGLSTSTAVYQSSDGSTSLARTFGGNARRHLTFANKPCLLVTGEARQEVRNPNIYQHVLIFDNKCGQAIDVKACYVESDRCVTQKIFAYKKVESILGIVAAAPRFDYKFNERF